MARFQVKVQLSVWLEVDDEFPDGALGGNLAMESMASEVSDDLNLLQQYMDAQGQEFEFAVVEYAPAESETARPCGCPPDYHLADCPTRTPVAASPRENEDL